MNVKANDTYKECYVKCAYDSVFSCIYNMFCIFIFCCTTTSYSTYVHLFVINLLTYIPSWQVLFLLVHLDNEYVLVYPMLYESYNRIQYCQELKDNKGIYRYSNYIFIMIVPPETLVLK